MIWTTKSGKEIQVEKMDDQYLINVLRLLQKSAEIKRLAIVSVYEDMPNQGGGIAEQHFLKMYDEVMIMTWLEFVDDVFHDLQYEAARRRLSWDLYGGGAITSDPRGIGVIDIDGPSRGTLERKIVGAVRDAIHSHGAITIATAPSAAKRVIGVIKGWNKEHR